jgi:hypothetical protein
VTLAFALVTAVGLVGCTRPPNPPPTSSTTTTPEPTTSGPRPASRPPVLLVGGTFESVSVVNVFVSVGGVDYGTTTANLCIGQGCTDMRHGSAFLASLNAGTNTPGNVSYYKIYSNPSAGGVEGEDAPIRGAINVGAQQQCHRSLLHADEYRSIIVESFLDNVFSGRGATATC